MRYVFSFFFLIISFAPGAEAQDRIGVEGYVFNSSGRPLSNAVVSAKGLVQGGEFGQIDSSDTNGFYQIDFSPTPGDSFDSFEVTVLCKNAKRREVRGTLPLYRTLHDGEVYRRDFYLKGEFENGRCK